MAARSELVLGALVFGSALTPVADGDLFWHLAAGREMWRTFALLRTDPFSVDAAGREWIDVHWLFQLGVYGVHALAGLRGLVISKALIVALAAVVSNRGFDAPDTSASAARWPFVVLLSSAMFVTRHSLAVRPLIVTLLLSSAFLAILERARRDQRPRALLWLPALQLVWANCQGLSGIGPALVSSYLLGELCDAQWRGRRADAFAPGGKLRALCLALALCAVASLLTPWGLRGPLLSLQLLLRFDPSAGNVYASDIAENVAPWVVEHRVPGTFTHLSVYLLILAGSFAAARRRLVVSHVLIACGLVVLALAASRNVLLLYWLATPIVAINFAPTFAVLFERMRRWSRFAARAAIGGVLSLVLGLTALEAVAFAQEPTLAEPTPFRFPTHAVAWLEAATGRGGGGGDIFAADHQGGYLIWSLYPRFRPFMDTRLVLRTRDEYADYLDLLAHPRRFDALQSRHHFAYALLPTAFPDRYLGLIRHLSANPDWSLVYTDGTETLFAFHGAAPAIDLGRPATTDALLAQCDARHRAAAELRKACRLNLATLDLTLGLTGEARRALGGAADPASQALLARCHLADGELADAEAVARRMLAVDDRDPEAATLLAGIELARGRPARALPWLRRALAQNPFDAAALELLDRVEHAAMR